MRKEGKGTGTGLGNKGMIRGKEGVGEDHGRDRDRREV